MMRRRAMDDFGAWLIEELNKRDWSQSDLARRSGLSRGTVNNIISGTRGRGPDSLRKIAKALGLPEEELFRASGILRPVTLKDALINRILHALETLPQEEKEELLEYIEFQRRKLERKKKPDK